MGYKHICDRCGAELIGEKYISILIEKPEDRRNGPSFYNSTKKISVINAIRKSQK